MLIQEVEEIFFEKSLKCGSHKKILSDIRLFDQEMDIDTLKSVKFLNQGIELAFELSIKNDLIIYLPQFYPFKIPEIYILDKEKRIQLKEFVSKKKLKIIKTDQFSKLNEMFIQDIPSINLVEILEEVMTILKPYKIGWFTNK